MAGGTGVSGDRSDAATAGRHLALGWRSPRAAMREAGRTIGEGRRLGLVILSGAIVVLADPAEDGFPRFVAAQAANRATLAASLGEVALWSVCLLAVLPLFYGGVAGTLWLFTRPSPAKPAFAALRTAVAVASWVSTLPILATGLVASLAGFETVGGVLMLGLWTAYAGLCLSEATGLDARAGTGLALGATVLASVVIAAAIAGLYGTLIHDDFAGLADGATP
ncbi:MAG: hypothetical protein PGN25_22890 [Methylorubrum populi]